MVVVLVVVVVDIWGLVMNVVVGLVGCVVETVVEEGCSSQEPNVKQTNTKTLNKSGQSWFSITWLLGQNVEGK